MWVLTGSIGGDDDRRGECYRNVFACATLSSAVVVLGVRCSSDTELMYRAEHVNAMAAVLGFRSFGDDRVNSSESEYHASTATSYITICQYYSQQCFGINYYR